MWTQGQSRLRYPGQTRNVPLLDVQGGDQEGRGVIVRLQDWLLERRIRKQQALVSAPGIGSLERSGHWQVLRELVLQRSPEQVERMERAKGLR
jgi:hypothetical protein